MTVDSGREAGEADQLWRVTEGGGDRDQALSVGLAALGEALARAAERGAWTEVQALSGALKRLTALQATSAKKTA